MDIGTYLWAPGLTDVADYCPAHTVPFNGPDDVPLRTFTATTEPTDATVQRMIADEVAWVLSQVASVPERFYDSAAASVKLRVAGKILMTHPLRESDADTAGPMMISQGTDFLMSFRDNLPADARSAAPLYDFPDPLAYPQ